MFLDHHVVFLVPLLVGALFNFELVLLNDL